MMTVTMTVTVTVALASGQLEECFSLSLHTLAQGPAADLHAALSQLVCPH
jgi:hypothetical protein